MKKLLLFLVLIFPLILCSQRPNKKRIAIPYLQPPSNPLNKNIESYFSSVVNNSTVFQPTSPNLKLKGYQRAESSNNADLDIKFVINNVSFSSNVFKEKYKKKVNDSTYVSAEGGRYSVEAVINFSEYVTDIKNNKNIISNEGILSNKSFVSSLIKNYGEAVKIHNSRKRRDAIGLYVQIANESINRFIVNVNNNYGYPFYYYYMPFARGRGRKHDYYDLAQAFNDFEKVREITKKAFSGNNPPRYGSFSAAMRDELSKKLDGCIEIWQNAINEYVPKKRKARIGDKIIDHLYLNLSAGYFLKGNWNKVYQTLSKVNLGKSEIKKASKFKSKVKELENRVSINEIL